MYDYMDSFYLQIKDDYFGGRDYWKNNMKGISAEDFDLMCRNAVLKWFDTEAPKGSKKPDIDQAAAISSMNKNVQVVARAGSGKTTTIIGRANFLINYCHVKPQCILMLAFNTEAAKEMRNRMIELTGSEENIPHIRTFHSLAYAVANRNVENRKHIVFDNDEENLFDIKDKRKALSQVVQQIIQSMIRENPDYETRFRTLMDSYFRGVWDTIEAGGYNLPPEDQLTLRRSMETRTLNDEEVDGIKEKIIADILFEHKIPYYPFIKNGIITVPINGKRKLKFKCTEEQKGEEYYQWCLREQNMVVLGPMEFAQGVSYIESLVGQAVVNEGKEFIKLSEQEIWRKIQPRAIDDFTKAMTTFVSRCRKQDLSINDLSEKIRAHKSVLPIEDQFLELAKDVYRNYVQVLKDNNWEDFDSLIKRATLNIQNGQVLFGKTGDFTEISHIMIDEYQDFSYLFDMFISTIQSVCPDASLFCVGDDWQAINGFAGSDTKYFNGFCKRHTDARRYYLSTNYRSVSQIVETSNRLMAAWSKNGVKIKASRKDLGSVELGYYDSFTKSVDEMEMKTDEETIAIVRLIRYLLAKNKKVVLLFRVRYKLERGYLNHIKSFFSQKEADYITAYTTHKYKGKEEEAVIIVDAMERKYPLIHPTWFFFRIFDDEYRRSVLQDFSEKLVGDITLRKIEGDEKKLFYVALTRARDNLFILTNHKNMSRFLTPGVLKTASEFRWDKYDLNKNEANVITIEVKNNGDEYTTIPISKQLRAAGYSFEKKEKYWYKKMRVTNITDNPVLSEDWVRNANHVFVEIKDNRNKLLSEYVIIKGRIRKVEDFTFA